MKARTIILTAVMAALVVPAAQARTDYSVAPSTPSSSTEIQALTARGDALNRQYHLGTYGTSSNADAIRALKIRGEALNRAYGLGDAAPVRFQSDVANSDAVARFVANEQLTAQDAIDRYVANLKSDTSSGTVSTGGDGISWSPATVGGIVGCLLLVSLGGFVLTRRSHRPVRPV